MLAARAARHSGGMKSGTPQGLAKAAPLRRAADYGAAQCAASAPGSRGLQTRRGLRHLFSPARRSACGCPARSAWAAQAGKHGRALAGAGPGKRLASWRGPLPGVAASPLGAPCALRSAPPAPICTFFVDNFVCNPAHSRRKARFGAACNGLMNRMAAKNPFLTSTCHAGAGFAALGGPSAALAARWWSTGAAQRPISPRQGA